MTISVSVTFSSNKRLSLQALRRLGGKSTMSASERLKAKKKGNIGKQVSKVRDVSVVTSVIM